MDHRGHVGLTGLLGRRDLWVSRAARATGETLVCLAQKVCPESVTGIMGPRENVDRLIKRIEKLEHEILFEHPSEEHPNGTSVMFKPSLEPQHTDMSTEVEKVAHSSSTVV